MQSDFENVNFQESYDHFGLLLHDVSDRLAKFLIFLAGRTVKISLSPKGPGVESRRPKQKCYWSERISSISQCAEKILNKIAKAINKTFAGLKCMLQGFRICLFKKS